MKEHYKCPNCRKNLNIGNSIVLLVRKNKTERGIIHLHTELGNYTTETSSDFDVKDGDHVCFMCPVCHFDISIKKNNKLARLIRIDKYGDETTIIISGIMGEKCTYEIKNRKVIMSYGEQMYKYTNPEWYLDI